MSALLVAVVMMAVTVVPAFAAEHTETITNGVEGHTFAVYQIFSGDGNREGTNGVLSNIQWGSGIDKDDFTNALINCFGWNSAELKSNESFDANKVAKKLAEITEENQKNEIARIANQNKTTASVENLSFNAVQQATVTQGYYLIVDTTQNLANGDMINPAILKVNGPVTINSKKDRVDVDKEVKKESENNEAYDHTTTTSIGDIVTFKLHTQIINQNNLNNYDTYWLEFSDTLSKGLDFIDNSVKVYLSDDGKIDANDTEITSFFEVSSLINENDGGHSFTVKNENIKNDSLQNNNIFLNYAGKHVIVTYNAKLNQSAEIGNPGNPNTVKLIYSNNPNDDQDGKGETEEKTAIVFTFELDGTKTNPEGTSLSNAEFVLYRKIDNNITQYAKLDSDGKIEKFVTENNPITEDSTNYDDYKIVSNSNGKFNVTGLGDGTYYLEEIKAPTGYNKLSVIEFEISSSINKEINPDLISSLEIDIKSHTNKEVNTGTGTPDDGKIPATVIDTKGTTLPETGGMGTTLLYVAGGILLIGSAVLLVTKKRMGNEN